MRLNKLKLSCQKSIVARNLGLIRNITLKSANSRKCLWFENIWRKGQDSNLHHLSGGGFQDPCI